MSMHKDYFKGKKITVMGLGLLGRGVGDVSFLARQGADLIVTDLKSEVELQESLDKLKEYNNITYVLGEHRLEDFRDRDVVIKAAGVPFDSPYIEEACKNNIPVEMSTSLFARLADVQIVGVTGTRGKSTVTHLMYKILQEDERTVHLGGNVRGVSTLALLDEVQTGDWVVMELDSWQLQGFGESQISPHSAIFTNFMPDHMNYYRGDMEHYFNDKANIFLNQELHDSLIVGEDIAQKIKEHLEENSSRLYVSGSELVPDDWKVKLIGEHNRKNIALAIQASELLQVPEDVIKKAVEEYTGMAGRLEFIREVSGVKFYNDTTATTPDATRAALKAFNDRDHTILIMGGADKQLDMSELVRELSTGCKAIILLPGTGTDKLNLKAVTAKIIPVTTFTEAIGKAIGESIMGDVVVLSPAFASFGMFANEFDRGDQFNTLVNNI